MGGDDAKDPKPPLPKFPEWPVGADGALIAAKAVASLVGGGDLFDLLKLRIHKRQGEWLNGVAQCLSGLQAEKRLSMEEVLEDPRFHDAVVTGLEAVRGTRDEEKRAALRNAVLNVALGLGSDETEQEIFLGLVGRFTGSHLRLLKVFADAPAWATASRLDLERAGHTTDSFLAAAIPGLAGRPAYYKALWKDLFQAGLVTRDELSMFTSDSNAPSWRHGEGATELGREFLRFIEEPVLKP